MAVAPDDRIYRPLGDGEVRLLRIEPVANPLDRGCDIYGFLETVSIDAMPEYVALSYVSMPRASLLGCKVQAARIL